MSFRKLLLAGAALAASTAAVAPANASIIDRPHFKVLGVVIVWSADDATGTTPIATDFVIDDQTGSGDTDLIGGTNVDGRTVVTGSLTATADASSTAGLGSVLSIDDSLANNIATVNTDTAASFAAFDVSDATLTGAAMTYESSFYVASNTAFNIDGVATQTAASGDFAMTDIGYNMGVTVTGTDGSLTFGGNAQDPQGTFGSFSDLSLVDGSTPVYEGGRRTAASAGSIVDQSVRFDATYTLGAGGVYDLSQGAGEIQADVVYTVYVP
ncbi:MAG: hypothetical protein NXH72_09115 [Hyphomonadaceae bacterium]|nr:hypothetical protein [Hyphomonadaceae bacterium]